MAEETGLWKRGLAETVPARRRAGIAGAALVSGAVLAWVAAPGVGSTTAWLALIATAALLAGLAASWSP